MSRKGRAASGEVVHLELYVVPSKHRNDFRKSLLGPISIAQTITRRGGGSGPFFYRVDVGRKSRSAPSITSLLGARRDEDLWIEIASYPSWKRRRSVVKEIWGNSDFTASVEDSDRFVSRRRRSYGVANAERRL